MKTCLVQFVCVWVCKSMCVSMCMLFSGYIMYIRQPHAHAPFVAGWPTGRGLLTKCLKRWSRFHFMQNHFATVRTLPLFDLSEIEVGFMNMY